MHLNPTDVYLYFPSAKKFDDPVPLCIKAFRLLGRPETRGDHGPINPTDPPLTLFFPSPLPAVFSPGVTLPLAVHGVSEIADHILKDACAIRAADEKSFTGAPAAPVSRAPSKLFATKFRKNARRVHKLFEDILRRPRDPKFKVPSGRSYSLIDQRCPGFFYQRNPVATRARASPEPEAERNTMINGEERIEGLEIASVDPLHSTIFQWKHSAG